VLAGLEEQELRALGMGYRAKFLRGSAVLVEGEAPGWLEGLRTRGRLEVQEQLLRLPGVGRKVAGELAVHEWFAR
jgi:3-methyladenine DNA glycosylase/8-oxoguanine DNA glycosylase